MAITASIVTTVWRRETMAETAARYREVANRMDFTPSASATSPSDAVDSAAGHAPQAGGSFFGIDAAQHDGRSV